MIEIQPVGAASGKYPYLGPGDPLPPTIKPSPEFLKTGRDLFKWPFDKK